MGLMRHPYPTICVNVVAMAIVQGMQANGIVLDPELEDAVTLEGQSAMAIEMLGEALAEEGATDADHC
jgi:hypothetical protein